MFIVCSDWECTRAHVLLWFFRPTRLYKENGKKKPLSSCLLLALSCKLFADGHINFPIKWKFATTSVFRFCLFIQAQQRTKTFSERKKFGCVWEFFFGLENAKLANCGIHRNERNATDGIKQREEHLWCLHLRCESLSSVCTQWLVDSGIWWRKPELIQTLLSLRFWL